MATFSIIIPLFNKENFVPKTIKSVLDQSFQDFELLIVNDFSTDQSVNVIENIEDSRIKIIHHEKNKGLSATRNTGIKNAKSDYIVFLDADDYWKNTFLETIFNLIKDYPQAQIFATAYTEVFPNNQLIAPKINNEDLQKESSYLISDFFKSNLNQPLYNHSSVCYHKTVFDTIGNFDETITFAEDVDFNIRVNLHFKLAYANSVQSFYTIFSENQITNSTIYGKKLPEFDQFEKYTKDFPSLKKYLDFERYVMAKHYKIANRMSEFQHLKSKMDLNNLNLKQRILLNFPASVLILIKKYKTNLLLKGKRVSSY